MTHYIDKDALLKGINELKKNLSASPIVVIEDVIALMESFEVKEVDLDIKQRIEECPYRQIGCTMYNGHILECRGACS